MTAKQSALYKDDTLIAIAGICGLGAIWSLFAAAADYGVAGTEYPTLESHAWMMLAAFVGAFIAICMKLADGLAQHFLL